MLSKRISGVSSGRYAAWADRLRVRPGLLGVRHEGSVAPSCGAEGAGGRGCGGRWGGFLDIHTGFPVTGAPQPA